MPTFLIKSFGCKVNRAEADVLAADLLAAGFTTCAPPAVPDAVIVNGCAVTAEAERKARQYLRRARREHPDACIVLTGCAADLAAGDAADLLIPQAEKGSVAGRLADLFQPDAKGKGPAGGGLPEARTRLFLKVQDGCPNRCAYCIVSLIRREVSSLPAGEAVAAVRTFREGGGQEVVLSGINLGLYRCPESGSGLAGLIEAMLAGTDLPRLHLSSLEPEHLDDGLIALFAGEPRLIGHLHLPMQSGDPAVLKAMGRRYTPEGYLERLEALRGAAPELALTTDIIVGFPGEDESAFARTLEAARRARFARMHVFPYSDRPGTAAALLDAPRPAAAETKARARRMLDLSAELHGRFLEGLIGRPATVLLEAEKGGFLTGLSERYVRYFLPAGEAGAARPGEIVRLNGAGRHGEGLLASV